MKSHEAILIRNNIQLITSAYNAYRQVIYLHVCSRIANVKDAEDIVQDVFLHLMNCQQIICKDAIKSFVYTIANNLINDYLRRFYRHQAYNLYIWEQASNLYDEEENYIARDLEAFELYLVKQLPPQRQKIYLLSRYEDQNTYEISQRMHLSPRTVENHLWLGRKSVREYIRRFI